MNRAAKLRRWLAALLLVGALATSWIHERRPPPDWAQRITVTSLPVPPASVAAPHLGPFRLEKVWQITSRNPMFGGWSTLQKLADGSFLSISDLGYALRFAPPDRAPVPVRMRDIVSHKTRQKEARDAESSAYDPETGRIWIGWEGANAISRHGPDLRREAIVRPPAMRDWDANSGPEAMVRLADGRFLVLAEGFAGWFESRLHRALLFPGDPTGSREPLRFRMSAPKDFSPTDVARMPDGRLLILMRRMVWPFPYRFVGRIVLADPADIRAGRVWQTKNVAYLSSSLPVDNFEGIVIEPADKGRLAVWLISDDNQAATQRTLLWKLTVDPRDLH